MDSLLNINMFDAVVIGLIILLSIKGLLSGFTKELFNSMALIGGLFIASFYKSEVAQYAKESLGLDFSTKLLELISLLLIFFVTFFIVKLIYKVLNSFILDDEISTPSRLLGMLIKMFTLFFIFSLIVYALSSKPQVTNKFKDTLNSSKIYPILSKSGAYILNISSNNIEDIKPKESSENNTTVTKIDSEASHENEETDSKGKKESEHNKTVIKSEEKNITKEEEKEENSKEATHKDKEEESLMNTKLQEHENNKTAKVESETNSSISDKNITQENSDAEHNSTN